MVLRYPSASFFEFVHVRIVITSENLAECGKSSRHGNRIGVVGAAVENFMLRDQVHHRRAGAERRERQSAADGFGQTDHVRMNVEVFRRAAPAEFSPGFYFVEYQERAIFRGEVAEAFQETGLGHAETNIHQDRLENDGGNLAGIFFESALDGGEIVERGDLHIGDSRLGYAESARDSRGVIDVAEFGSVRLDADQSGIMQAMIGALKFNNFVATGGGTREADGVHGGFGAAI